MTRSSFMASLAVSFVPHIIVFVSPVKVQEKLTADPTTPRTSTPPYVELKTTWLAATKQH